MVLLELNGNPGHTFKLKRDLQEQPLALQEHICKLASLPDSWNLVQLPPMTVRELICGLESYVLPDGWNREYLRETDLVLSIGDAAISDEMSLHQNGQCCLPDGCDPLSL